MSRMWVISGPVVGLSEASDGEWKRGSQEWDQWELTSPVSLLNLSNSFFCRHLSHSLSISISLSFLCFSYVLLKRWYTVSLVSFSHFLFWSLFAIPLFEDCLPSTSLSASYSHTLPVSHIVSSAPELLSLSLSRNYRFSEQWVHSSELLLCLDCLLCLFLCLTLSSLTITYFTLNCIALNASDSEPGAKRCRGVHNAGPGDTDGGITRSALAPLPSFVFASSESLSYAIIPFLCSTLFRFHSYLFYFLCFEQKNLNQHN